MKRDASRSAFMALTASPPHRPNSGTMERPALKRLIADIEAGQIDVVVVYKVDRLTRAPKEG